MAKRFNEVDFIVAYNKVLKAGGTVGDLAGALGVSQTIVHGRTFLLRRRGFRLPRLRRTGSSLRRIAARPVQVEPTIGDTLEFDTAFLHKPVQVQVLRPSVADLTFSITVSQDAFINA